MDNQAKAPEMGERCQKCGFSETDMLHWTEAQRTTLTPRALELLESSEFDLHPFVPVPLPTSPPDAPEDSERWAFVPPTAVRRLAIPTPSSASEGERCPTCGAEHPPEVTCGDAATGAEDDPLARLMRQLGTAPEAEIPTLDRRWARCRNCGHEFFPFHQHGGDRHECSFAMRHDRAEGYSEVTCPCAAWEGRGSFVTDLEIRERDGHIETCAAELDTKDAALTVLREQAAQTNKELTIERIATQRLVAECERLSARSGTDVVPPSPPSSASEGERCGRCGLPNDPARPPHKVPAILSTRWGGCHECYAPDPARGIVPHEPKCHPFVPSPLPATPEPELCGRPRASITPAGRWCSNPKPCPEHDAPLPVPERTEEGGRRGEHPNAAFCLWWRNGAAMESGWSFTRIAETAWHARDAEIARLREQAEDDAAEIAALRMRLDVVRLVYGRVSDRKKER